MRLTAFGRVKKAPLKPERNVAKGKKISPKTFRRVYFDESGFKRVPVYERDALRVGAKINGPAIIEEQTATTILRKGNVLTNDRFRNLVIEV